jgi:hypothetical protein
VTQNSLLKTDFELLTIVMNFIERNTHDMKWENLRVFDVEIRWKSGNAVQNQTLRSEKAEKDHERRDLFIPMNIADALPAIAG